jgi:hypothetical protein
MKRNSKRKTSLKSSVILLLFLAIFLVASSYAWFTSNRTVTVSSLQVNVQAQNGLQVSVDGTNWRTVLSNSDITQAFNTYAAAVNQIPTIMEPVSTGKTVDAATGFLNMYYGTVEPDEEGDYRLSSVQSVETNGNTGRFIAFDLFIRVDAQTPVYITPSSGVRPNGTDTGLKNASRMAFLVEGNVPVGSALATIQGLKGATPATTYIWEPNYDVHTTAGVANAYDTYGITTTTTGASAINYAGLISAIDPENAVLLNEANATDNPTYFADVIPAYRTVEGFSSNVSFVTLSAGITKIRVYMWVEGQDVDCENTASGSDITFDLQITSNEA